LKLKEANKEKDIERENIGRQMKRERKGGGYLNFFKR
jgi:hypothetical protein